MCLISHEVESTYAEKDIHVYKVLRRFEGVLYSPYFKKFTWRLGEINQSQIIANRTQGKTHVDNGLHSFMVLREAESLIIAEFNYSNEYHVYNAIIPAGARYYIGINGDLVSSHLKITQQQQQ